MFIPDIDSTLFYTQQILASLVLVLGLRYIDKRLPGGEFSTIMVTAIICLTITFAVFNLLTHVGYHNGNYILHGVYSTVSDIINTAELAVLFLGSTIGLYLDGSNTRMGSGSFINYLYRSLAVVRLSKAQKWKD